jgi:hypothetical protein
MNERAQLMRTPSYFAYFAAHGKKLQYVIGRSVARGIVFAITAVKTRRLRPDSQYVMLVRPQNP